MVPVKRRLAPRGFNKSILAKGRAWLRSSGLPSRGPLPPGTKIKPLWTDCLDDLYDAYGGVCAYLSIYIEPVVGERTVDHFVPKTRRVELAYRWSNFRLACLTMNRRKHDHEDVLDPFTLPDETFHLNLLDGRIAPNAALKARDPDLYRRAGETITRLGLDDEACRRLRRERALGYMIDPTPAKLSELRRRAPFVWREIIRQGLA